MSDRDLANLEREAQRSPGDIAVLVRLGNLYERAQRLRDAFLAYTRARQAAPEDELVREHWRRLGGEEESKYCERLVASASRASTERSHAASMLGVCGGELGRAALCHALRTDPHFAVRQTAAAALGELRDGEASGVLVAALDDESAWVRARATDALCRMHERPGGYARVTTAPAVLEPLVTRWKRWWAEEARVPR